MMSLRKQLVTVTVAVITLLATFPAAAQCDNGREGILADVALGSSALEWRVLAEHRAVTLTVSAPCGLVVERTYDRGDNPFFDLREIPADPDGVYHWQLRISPEVDPKVEKLLQQARASGEDQTIEYELRQEGMLPEGPFLQTGAFTVVRGSIVPPDEQEEGEQSGKLSAGVRPAASVDSCPFSESAPTVASNRAGNRLSTIAPAVDRGGSNRPVATAAAEPPRKMAAPDFLVNDDLIIIGSQCVGFDCVNGEVFSFDTIRLKENNLRIKFEDTSTAGSFPTRDWEIEVNSSTNGGQSHFRINDVDGARSPFTIEAAAPSHSLYVDSSGRIGRKTANPVLELHMVDGDTPSIRLEQDTSSGFGAQTWDIAGNETNFFVRDASSGSTLPFRIFPGSPSNSLVIRNGDVGIGTTSPARQLDVIATNAADNTVLEVENNGATRIRINNGATGEIWNVGHQTPAGTGLVFSDVGDAVSEMLLDVDGNMQIAGTLTTGGPSCGGGCDFVFDPAYPLESIEAHAERMWKNRHLPAVGPTPEGAPFNLSEKTGGILNELETAHIYIEQLNERLQAKERSLAEMREHNEARLAELHSENQELKERLDRLERLVQ